MLKFRWENNFKPIALGDIPKDWDVGFVIDVARINELSISRDCRLDCIEYIDIASVDKGQLLGVQIMPLSEAPSRAKRIVRDNDILISTVRPNLRHFVFVKKAKPNTIASTGFAVLSPFRLNQRYLYYYLTSEPLTEYLTQISDTQTSTYPAFNPEAIEKAETPLPIGYGTPEGEDVMIGAILSWFDDLIGNKKKQNVILEKTALAFFQKWFDGSEPVEAQEVMNSNQGRTISGWKITSLYDLAEWVNGFPFDQKTLNLERRGSPVIKIAELQNGVTEATQYFDGEIDPIYSLKQGDLLFAWSASVGVYIWSSKSGVLNQHIFKVFPKIDRSFFYFLLKKLDFLFQRIVENKATTMGHVTVEDLKRVKTFVPDENKRSHISAILDPLFHKITLNEQEITALQALRDALLLLLVFGKLRVEKI